MTLTSRPVHVQVLLALKGRVEARREKLRAETGNGLPDLEYRQHVGRIREDTLLLGEIETFISRSVDELEDLEEEIDRESEQRRAQRRAKRT